MFDISASPRPQGHASQGPEKSGDSICDGNRAITLDTSELVESRSRSQRFCTLSGEIFGRFESPPVTMYSSDILERANDLQRDSLGSTW